MSQDSSGGTIAYSGQAETVNQLVRQKVKAARLQAKILAPGEWFDDPTHTNKAGDTEIIYYSVRRYVPESEVKAGGYILVKGEYIKDGTVRTKSGREKRITRKGHAWNEEVKI